MVEIEGLKFHYESGFCLEVDSMAVPSGSSVAWIGASGTGKTTLLHLAAGIYRPHSGTLRTCGIELAKLGDSRCREFRIANVGLVFQDFALLDYLNVLENILLPFRLSATLKRSGVVEDRARRLATDIGIEPLLKRHPARLSQGERQRVAVCRALVAKPQLLLADEPTANLDPENASRVIDALHQASREDSSTLVVVSHDQEVLHRFDQVVDLSGLTSGRQGDSDV